MGRISPTATCCPCSSRQSVVFLREIYYTAVPVCTRFTLSVVLYVFVVFAISRCRQSHTRSSIEYFLSVQYTTPTTGGGGGGYPLDLMPGLLLRTLTAVRAGHQFIHPTGARGVRYDKTVCKRLVSTSLTPIERRPGALVHPPHGHSEPLSSCSCRTLRPCLRRWRQAPAAATSSPSHPPSATLAISTPSSSGQL